jgi:hypothetical protein
MLQKKKSWIESILYRKIREVVAPISKEGIDKKDVRSEGCNGHVLATEFEDAKRPENFTPTTIIISGGYCVWELELPKDVRKELVDMTLTIETVRTHGLLHTKEKGKSASILVNDHPVDKMLLVKEHPYGEHYGVDSRRPLPVYRFIDREKNLQTIRVETEEGVSWDIDWVTLKPIIERKELRPEIAMTTGAIISASIGGIVSFFV